MNRSQQQFYKEQFELFLNCLTAEWGVGRAFILKSEERLKAIQKRYLSLACAATIIGNRSTRNEYSIGLIESSNLAMVLASKGVENTAGVLLRQTIEHTYKHIFFSTHPVEYSWAQNRNNFLVTGKAGNIEQPLELVAGEIHMIATFAGAAGCALFRGNYGQLIGIHYETIDHCR